ncbi:MAG: ABC transporter permease [Anaerolineae bacterium]|nr:ABC transporter permease [Anaerolineae bacterium]
MNFTAGLKRISRRPEFTSVVILLVIIFLNALLQKNFFATKVILTNLKTFTPLILISIGQAVIVLCGGIDLSVGSQVSLINVILATMMRDSIGDSLPVLLLALGAAVGMGAVNGFSAGYLNLPPMIATFATQAIFFGLALFVLPHPGGVIPRWAVEAFKWHVWLISTPLVVIVLAMLLWEYIRRRRLGQYIYAVGSSEEAAFANGINTRWVKLMSYMIGSFFVMLGAYAITLQAASGDARLGLSYPLTSIAAVVVGGISLQGGRGNVIGAVFGALVMNMVINLIYFANIPSEYQEFTKGFIIILALAMAVIYRRNGARRQTS